MELIIPAAGLSTRFPNMKPKYLLRDEGGVLMIKNAIGNLLGRFNTHIAVLKEHDEKYQAIKTIKDLFGDQVNIVVIDSPTRGPAETVYKVIKDANIKGSIFVRDCDNYWSAGDVFDENAVWTGDLKKTPYMTNVSAKSYVIKNDQNIITNIIEKQVVSENFVAGGYQFADANEYCNEFEYVEKISSNELFLSSVIDSMLSKGQMFVSRDVDNFIDVGTLSDWEEYNRHFIKVE